MKREGSNDSISACSTSLHSMITKRIERRESEQLLFEVETR